MDKQPKLLKEEINLMTQFQQKMVERFKRGNSLYGRGYLDGDKTKLITDIEEELLDTANYAMMLFMRIKGLKKIIQANEQKIL